MSFEYSRKAYRRMLDTKFQSGIISNARDFPALPSLINFTVPENSTRTSMSSHIPQPKSDYIKIMIPYISGLKFFLFVKSFHNCEFFFALLLFLPSIVT